MKINRIAILLVLGIINIIKVSINAQSFSGIYAPDKKGTYPTNRIFGNVRCPILRIKTNSTVRWSAGAA